MSLMTLIKFGYALVIVAFLLMMWASLSGVGALELHVDTGHPPCLFQALCTCSKPAGDLGIVTCAHVPIFRVPAAVNSSKVFTLQLTDNHIKDLDPQFFQTTGMYRLAINKNPLESIHEEAFYGLDNTLWELELQEDKLTAVPSRALRYLQKLRLLDLTGNEITDISGDNWLGLENTLHTLVLADNSISSLPLDAFSGLPMLETLDLRGNHLTVIDSGVFRDGMNRLSKLILADNQLQYIPYEELSPLRQLRFLDLANNLIRQVPPVHDLNGVRLNLDWLKLDNNNIKVLMPGSFNNFNVLNQTSLDGNQIYTIREDAFRNAKIRALSLRDCSINNLSPASFAGLENSLQSLDLSENNLTTISKFMLNKLDSLRFLNLRENKVDTNLLATNYPSEYSLPSVNNFQYKLFHLDISGTSSLEMSLQDVRRDENDTHCGRGEKMRSLRYLAVSKLIRRSITSEDFLEFGVDLEDLKIFGSTINRIESSAFQHVRTIKTLDLSENHIEYIDPFAFAELHSLTTLKMANGLHDSVKVLPFEPLKALIELQYLDVSNNRLQNVPDTSFHFLYKLKTLNLQDNLIDHFSKGTLQGDIHRQLEGVYLSLNKIRVIEQHTFVNLKELQEIHLEDNLIESLFRRSFTSMDNLKVINLSGNSIFDISEEAFQNLPALKELDISFNRLGTFKFSIFDQVGSATALKVNASYNRIVALTDSNAPMFFTSNFYAPKVQRLISEPEVNISALETNISSLDTDIKMEPDEVYTDTEIESEDASPWRIERGLGTVSINIRVLDFSRNNITYIAPYYFRHADLTLSELYLSHNQLRNITREVFGSMLMLQLLDLSHNMIYHMEYDCFKKVRNLQIINLSHNNLIDLPVEVFHDMHSLTFVDLSHNYIKNLASNLIPSPALERLDLSDNELSRIPTNALSPAAAINLVELDLSGNSIPAISIADLVQTFRPDGEYWGEEADYSDDYMYHTARRDHTRVFHHKKQYPQNILYKSLAWLDLSGNHLVRVEGGAFTALPRLRWLDLSRNLPFSNDRNIFKGLERRLSHLGLQNTSLTAVPVLPLPKLKSLDLSYNNLHSLATEVTANLTRLRKLDLSYNDLTSVPVATHSLSELRWLSLSGNPITALMNTSLYGVSPRLEYLDVTRLRLNILERGAFSKLFGLRTLKISVSGNVRDFNFPWFLANNEGLENLYIDVQSSQIDLGNEMTGDMPSKVNNITITGRPFKFLSDRFFRGINSRTLRLTIYNTTIEEIENEVFWRSGRVKNLTLDFRGNYFLRIPNPGRSPWPGVPNSLFLQDVLVAGNPLVCDCQVGWIQAWDRKRRQYLCSSPTACVATRDDVRIATCPSHYNRTFNDVLLRDLDCAWNKGFSVASSLVVIGLMVLMHLNI